MSSENIKKSFVNEDGQTTIICPRCFRARTAKAQHPQGKSPIVNIHCSCDHRFKVQLEFRKHFRKETELVGVYILESPARDGGNTEIINLSQSGVCFIIRGIHNIEVGHCGTVEFTLDNRKQTELSKRFIVRNVTGNKIGCEFLGQQEFEKELGFYLRA